VSPLLTLEYVYVLMGALLGTVAIFSLRDTTNPKRYRNAGFWGVYAITFLVGSHLPHVGSLGAGTPQTTSQESRETSAQRLGNALFAMAIIVPMVTLIGTLTLKHVTIGGHPMVDPKQVTLISLALATLVALATIMFVTRPPVTAPLYEARRLLDSVGWAAVLPQLLAALGALFAVAGIGQIIERLAGEWIAVDNAFIVVMAYTFGMAILTILMGNAFAAFPVLTAGIGLPLIVHHLHGNPAIMAAIGMLSGFCGTLMTPMAANFNIVPTALLDIDEYAVIRVQLPTALLLLGANTLLMYFLVFRY
jgi:uncharacterized membrane protein